ncbi:MAG TPA: hypothetical protein VNI84_11200 [Pyrinomonadaceae bacterium]|nr:hypothetical protein [Pyrinomonadaceae bacterium]
MAAEKKESNSKVSAAKKKQSDKVLPSEINAPRWSVVSFEKCVAKNLIYAEAVEKLEHLQMQKISGLCIVTDEAAARISKSMNNG